MSATTCTTCGRALSSKPPPDFRAEILVGVMATAVVVETDNLRRLPWSDVARLANESATVIGSHGDDLQFGGKKRREAFAALARGLAALSFAPGGVEFFGAHWCARHVESESREGQYR